MAFQGMAQRRSPDKRAERAREDAIIRGFLADRRMTIERARRITYQAILDAPDESSRSRWTREHELLHFRKAAGRELPAVRSASLQAKPVDDGEQGHSAADPRAESTRTGDGSVSDGAQQPAPPPSGTIPIEPLSPEDPLFLEHARASVAHRMVERQHQVQREAEEREEVSEDLGGLQSLFKTLGDINLAKRREKWAAASRRYRRRKKAARAKLAAAAANAKRRSSRPRERRSTTKRRRR